MLPAPTGSLEAQNGVLGKRLMKHGHFFKFVSYLLSHEFTKAREFDLLIKSGGTTGPAKKRAYKVISNLILEKIRITYADNHICENLEDFSSVDIPREENGNFELFEDDENETQPDSSQSSRDVLRLMP